MSDGSMARGCARLAALFALVAIVPGCGRGDDAAAPAGPPPAIIGPENIAVAAETTLTAGPTLSGSLEPELAANVRAELTGSVLEVRADEGQPVKRGQLLVRIDDTAVRDAHVSARAALRSAETTLQLARRNAERAERLHRAGAVSERDVEDAQASVTSAEGQVADARSRLATAEKQLAKTVLRAPFEGVVADVTVSEGDVVQTGAALVTVVGPSSMRLEASVPVEQLAAIKPGTPVEFTVSGYPGRSFTGTIARVSPAVDPATRQVRVIVTLPNAQRTLVGGLFAEGHVATERREGVVVPRAAIDDRGIRPVAVRLKGGRVERIEVEVGLHDRVSERVEVTRGVAAGDTLLLGGAAGLTPGTPATVRQEQAAAR